MGGRGLWDGAEVTEITEFTTERTETHGEIRAVRSFLTAADRTPAPVGVMASEESTDRKPYC
jgi:hypothetical protein